MDSDKIWSAVLENFKINLSSGNFVTYFKPSHLLEIQEIGDRILCTIGVPNVLLKDVLDRRYYGQIVSELERLTEKKCEIKFQIKEIKTDHKELDALPLFGQEKRYEAEVYKKASIRPDFTFDNYAVSGSNQMAFAATTAVAKHPGTAYNPLFIYGGVGVGKTHLMQAIGNYCISQGETAVLFCTSEEFTNDLVESIRNKSTEKIRAKYRRLKLLMIDDVQFIAGKPTAQEEFFHTFNSIQKGGGQIVMTSDKPPSEIAKLEERLKSRFGAGMIVDVGQPDFELRCAILQIKAKNRSLEIDDEIVHLAAESITGLRELEGFLMQLQSRQTRPTLEIASEILKITKLRSPGRMITPNEMINQVCLYFNVGAQQLKGDRRSAHIVLPRQILMYLLKVEMKLPLEEIGRLLGGRDHTTVMHGSGKIQNLLETDSKITEDIHNIKKKLGINGG